MTPIRRRRAESRRTDAARATDDPIAERRWSCTRRHEHWIDSDRINENTVIIVGQTVDDESQLSTRSRHSERSRSDRGESASIIEVLGANINNTSADHNCQLRLSLIAWLSFTAPAGSGSPPVSDSVLGRSNQAGQSCVHVGSSEPCFRVRGGLNECVLRASWCCVGRGASHGEPTVAIPPSQSAQTQGCVALTGGFTAQG